MVARTIVDMNINILAANIINIALFSAIFVNLTIAEFNQSKTNSALFTQLNSTRAW